MAIDFTKHGSADPHVLADINTTPLIDVMLVLLVMLIITIPIKTHAVRLTMPASAPPQVTVQPDVVTVEVDFDGTILWNGQVVPDRATLEGKLLAAAGAPIQPELHLRPNRLASYKFVAAVLASAQRLGVTKIVLSGCKQLLE
jgi:biopolymer transport protein ExbD